MTGSGTYSFVDPQAYETSIPGASVNLLFMSPGDFKARLTRTDLHNLCLLGAREELPRMAYIALARDRNVIGFPLHADPPPIWNAVELRVGDIVFHGRGERFHQRTSGPTRWGWILLPSEHLTDYGRALSGSDIVVPAAGNLLRAPARATARLMRLHAQAGRLAERRADMIAQPEVARALEQDLTEALVACLTEGTTHPAWTEKRRHAGVMVRFEDTLATDPDHAWLLSEVCAIVGVSEFTVRACSREFLGISPGRYMILRRLNRVRRALLRADAATVTVAEHARRHGFTDLDRFAIAYRTVFGETPATTLRHLRGPSSRLVTHI